MFSQAEEISREAAKINAKSRGRYKNPYILQLTPTIESNKSM